jgi:hypothetical protein
MIRYLNESQQAIFGPDVLTLMSGALDDAWRSLSADGIKFAGEAKEASTRETLARRIVELATKGERDKRRLRDGALAALADANLRTPPPPPTGPRF